MTSTQTPERAAGESPPESSKSSTKGRIAKLALFGLMILAVLFAVFRSYPAGSAAGEIRSTTAPLGNFVVRPVTCFSGSHWGFHGVWVVTETQTIGSRRGFKGGLKIQKNNAGEWEAYVENPNICQGFKCQQQLVDKRHCQVFDVVVSDMSVFLRYGGHANIDCAFPEGGTLKADLSFHGCAAVPSQGADV